MVQRRQAGKCQPLHRILYVDQWTELGAFVECAVCGGEFFANQPLLDEWYFPFEYRSPLGPTEDKGIFVLAKEMEGRP